MFYNHSTQAVNPETDPKKRKASLQTQNASNASSVANSSTTINGSSLNNIKAAASTRYSLPTKSTLVKSSKDSKNASSASLGGSTNYLTRASKEPVTVKPAAAAARKSSMRDSSASLHGSTKSVNNTTKKVGPAKKTVKKVLSESVMRPTSASLSKQREKVVSYVDSTNFSSIEEIPLKTSVAQREQLPLKGNESEAESETISERNFYEEQEARQHDRYPPTPHQLYIYEKVCPDDVEGFEGASTTVTEFSSHKLYFTTQCFQVSANNVNLTLLSTAINKIAHTYKVLTTQFYKNERIIDADVEAFIETTPTPTTIPIDKYTTHHHQQTSSPLTPKQISTHLHNLVIQIQTSKHLDPVFHAHVYTSFESPKSFIGFIFSNAILDEQSATFVTNEIFNLYFEALGKETPLTTSRVFDSYQPKEQFENFTDFAYRLAAPSHNTTSYWKNLVIETVQESMEGRERDEIEAQRKGLIVECESLRNQIGTLTSRKAELEIELTTLRYQRRQIDVDNNGQVDVYVDPVTNQVSEISRAAKAAIIKVVLGSEAGDDHSIASLLAKHDCTSEIQAKLGHLNLDQFSTLSEDDLSILGLLSKDRRKVMALSEYCRNRIKESMQEQTKVKFALERKILKQQRDYDMCCSNLKAAQNSLDINDDMAIRLNYILNPPSFETKLLPLTLENNSVKDLWDSEYNQTWGFFPFEIDAPVVQNLRSFLQGTKATSRQQRKTQPHQATQHHHRSSSASSISSSEDESQLSSKLAALSTEDLRPQNTKAILLTALAVMLKHISGQEKFLLGSHESIRHNSSVLCGPLTDIIPIPFDFSPSKEPTFNSLLTKVQKVLKSSTRVTAETPYAKTAEKHLHVPSDFPIQFQYFCEKETHAWRHAGLSTRDLLGMKVFNSHESKASDTAPIVDLERIWTVNEAQSGCEFKLTFVEDAEEIVGVVQYRKAVYDEEKVGKWVSKLVTTLEGIEFGPKKLAVSQLIARYYSSVLLHTSTEEIEKSARRSLGSMHTLSESKSNSLFDL
ncbi:UNVERIFIED_CONTAM: hypothetical protein HDU68_009376 [Siphonaria sp. JEL0065]|nr:hypothetical protein HDU68_009376 [Siphonaria sp. JEL0065]